MPSIKVQYIFSKASMGTILTIAYLKFILQINGSLARAAIKELSEAGMIRPVSTHSKQIIYTRATNV